MPPVEGLVAGGCALECRIDEHAPDAAFLHEQLEVVRTRRALLEEQPAAGALHSARDGRIAGEPLDTRQELVSPRDGFEYSTGVGILSLQKRQPVRILGIFHPAIRVADGLTEE